MLYISLTLCSKAIWQPCIIGSKPSPNCIFGFTRGLITSLLTRQKNHEEDPPGQTAEGNRGSPLHLDVPIDLSPKQMMDVVEFGG